MKVRLSKKFVLILGGGLVLCGASGAAAVLIGTDKILGPSYRDLNGLECTVLQSLKFNRDQRIWVRKYVTSDESGDGMTRVRTALRVARAVQEKEKADLVQIAMIDPSGPKDRADMRGRMIAAQVTFIPDLAKVPEGAAAVNYSAYYLDGTPTSRGEYFGMRIDLPLEDVEHLEAKLTDKADCIDPAALAAEAAHGATKGGPEEVSGGHGEAKPSGDGEAAGHGEAPASETHEAVPAEGHGDEVAATESGGLMSSITGMFFGSKEEPKADHGAEADDHASAPVEAHGAAAEEPAGHGATAEGDPAPTQAKAAGDHAAPKQAGEKHAVAAEGGHSAAEADGGHDGPKAIEPAGKGHAATAETSDDHGEQAAKPVGADEAAKPAEAVHAGNPAVPQEPAEEQGFVDQLKGMIFGGSSDEADGASHEEARADAGHEAEQAPEPAPEPRTAAEGGKRWSEASERDEIRSDDLAADHDAPTAASEGEHTEAKAEGPSDADAAGAAWLEKFRAQSTAPATDGADH